MGVKRHRDRYQVDLRSHYVGIYSDERTASMIYESGSRQLELGKPLEVVIRELRGKSMTPTLGEYAEEWLPTCTTRDHAEARYRHRLAWQRMEPHVGRRRLGEMTRGDVAHLIERLSDSYSSRTVRDTHATLRMMLADALADRLVESNVAERPRNLPAPSDKPRTTLEVSEFRALVEAAPPRHRPLVALAGLTGMRMGELLGLHRSDVTPEGIRVSRQYHAKSHDEQPTKKDRHGRSKTRTIPLLPEAREWAQRALDESVRPDSTYLFPSVNGDAPISRTAVKVLFDDAAKDVGIEATPHRYRHSFGSWALQSGIPLATVAAWMGHTPEVLARIYAHEVKEARDENLSRLDSWLNGDHTGTDA